MNTRRILVLVGGITIALAAVGSITSISIVRAGGVEGGVSLTVNILLTVIGVILLASSRRRRGANPSARTTRPD